MFHAVLQSLMKTMRATRATLPMPKNEKRHQKADKGGFIVALIFILSLFAALLVSNI